LCVPAARAPGKERRRAKPAKTPAAELSVARVAVDVSLPHLDRPFDYLVEDKQSDAAQPGCRVRVRFSGQLVGGYVLERLAGTEHEGRLAYLERVVSPEPVLTPEIASLARASADRWAGSVADVLRLAVPPRHAATESAARGAPPGRLAAPAPGGLDRYDGGPALLDGLANGESPRVVLAAAPGDWPAELAAIAAATLHSGRGVVLAVPDHRDVARVDMALSRALGPARHVALTADLGPAQRYARFLALSRGEVRCVVGTRAAVWAPVRDIGVLVVWDDGDDLLAEPRAPYCHARDVAILRAHRAEAGLVLAGHAVTAEAAALVGSGWAAALDMTARTRAAAVPAVRAAADEPDDRDPLAAAARLPSSGWKAAQEALKDGAPVLVQVPRRGYQPALSCDHCRAPARCAACAGPLSRRAADRPPQCGWCGVAAVDWTCPHCGRHELRAVVVGARRTAEELGRAFPGVPVRTSGGDAVLDQVPDRPALVVATPGAEPVAAGGYGAALLLDGWALLARPDLRAGEESLRRWLNAAALVRGQADGGRVVLVAPSELRPVQALLRWQPRWHADRENDDRAALHLPPAARMAALTGTAAAVAELLELADLPPGAEVLGPVADLGRPRAQPGRSDAAPTPVAERMLVRVPRRSGAALADALKAAASVRSARKAPDPVRIELDPQQLG
jgi:primosomal protein N' (replication factor Y)